MSVIDRTNTMIKRMNLVIGDKSSLLAKKVAAVLFNWDRRPLQSFLQEFHYHLNLIVVTAPTATVSSIAAIAAIANHHHSHPLSQSIHHRHHHRFQFSYSDHHYYLHYLHRHHHYHFSNNTPSSSHDISLAPWLRCPNHIFQHSSSLATPHELRQRTFIFPDKSWTCAPVVPPHA